MRTVNTSKRVEALACVPVFAGLTRSSLAQVAEVATEVEAAPGQTLIEAGTNGAGMFVLIEGEATVDTRGKRAIALHAGECFGELALLTQHGTRTARVRAKTPVRCLAIARSDFQRLLRAEPKVALALLESLATRLADRD
jgi:CRP-like cAMP-binding protein